MADDALETIAGRLAAGAVGRTEADVQADVRAFLLEAKLELEGQDLVDVALEAQAGGGRRIDVEAGCAAIEVKKSLASPKVLEAATDQLAGYVAQRTAELGQRYVGVLTDGKAWMLHHGLPSGTLALVDTFTLTRAQDADRLAAWLEVVLATRDQIRPVPREILSRLGAGSPGFELDLADLRALYTAVRDDPEVKLKRELWARLLVAALGTAFEATDDLFVTHTYLVLTAELLAHAVVEIPIDSPGTDVRAMLEGAHFNTAGLHGLVEADFFDWPAATQAGAPIVRAIARRIARFDWTMVEHDVLKALYDRRPCNVLGVLSARAGDLVTRAVLGDQPQRQHREPGSCVRRPRRAGGRDERPAIAAYHFGTLRHPMALVRGVRRSRGRSHAPRARRHPG